MNDFEPTLAQIETARALRDAGTHCVHAEAAWGAALYELHAAVQAAKDAGIPKEEVTALVTARRSLGGGTREQLRKSIRNVY